MKWYWIVAIAVSAIAVGYGLYYIINTPAAASTGAANMTIVPGTGASTAAANK